MAARFTRAELDSFRGAKVPDLLPGPDGPPLRLLFVGINPGLWTAATQTHFAHPVNRFYPALERAGIIERPVDPAAGMSEQDRDHLLRRGIGITNLVPRASARADELSAEELREGGARLARTVRRARPAVVAVAGITAYRSAFGMRGAKQGRQPADLDGLIRAYADSAALDRSSSDGAPNGAQHGTPPAPFGRGSWRGASFLSDYPTT